jgi:hypothetical protein
MTSNELYDVIIAKKNELVPNINFTTLQEAMLEECCENAVKAENANALDTDQLIIVAVTALEVCQSLMKGVVRAGLSIGDIVNVNYRGRTFTYPD